MAKISKKGHFLTFEVIKRVKNEKYQKTVRIIFEGPYKDALFKFIDNLNKNWGTSSIFRRNFFCINFAEKWPFFSIKHPKTQQISQDSLDLCA